MKICRVLVAVVAIAGCSGSDEDSVEQAAQSQLAPPTVTVLGTTDSSITVQVCAGPTGAKAGFTLQWISAAGRAAGGWEDNAERCGGSFSGQANASPFALGPNQCTTVELGTAHADAPGMSLSCTEVDCRQRYVVRGFAHAYAQQGDVFKRSDYTADVAATTARCARGLGKGLARDVRTALARFGDDAETVDIDDDGVPRFVRGSLGSSLPDAVKAFRLDANALALRKTNQGADGTQFFRYQQKHNGLDVIGGDLVVAIDSKGTISSVNGTARGDIFDGLGANAVGEDAAIAAVAKDPRFAGLAQSAVRTVYLNSDGDSYLAYEIEASGERSTGDTDPPDPVRDRVYVDADTGAIVAVHPQIHSSKNRATYSANNGTSLPGTLKRSEGQDPTIDIDVNAAHDNAGSTYDAYQAFFNRDSYNNAGAQIRSSVHYSINYCNAFWNGSQMVYGDGNGSDCYPLARAVDVVGHELTHAVTENESGLIYSGESGGINESISDVFGAFIEAYVLGGGNGTLDSSQDKVWLIGDEILPPYLRSMCDPAADGASRDFWTSGVGNVDVHYSSGVGNLMFCLLAKGGTHPRGKSTVVVAGIGMDKAIRVVYDAAANVLTSTSNYLAYRNAMLTAAGNLQLTQEEKDAVQNAWAAVGVGSPVGAPPEPPPGDVVLQNNVAVTGISGAQGTQKFYSLAVPAGATGLKFVLAGGTGDADMYVKFGSKPTRTSYDCRPYLNGNSETCNITTAQAGTYYVMIDGYTSYSGTSIKGSFSTTPPSDPILVNGVPVTGLSGLTGSAKYYRIAVPAATPVTVRISGGTGDADLYTRWGARPTTSTWSCRPYLNGNTETCTNSQRGAGDLYIMIRGYTSYSGVTLTATY